jgi:ribosomal protein S18 acetylase RimI-like enzyme
VALTSRPYEDGDLRLMLQAICDLWPHGRHSVGYAFMAQRLPYDDRDARLWFDGDTLVGWGWSTGWRTPRGLSYEFRPGYRGLLEEMLEWAAPELLTVKSGDDETVELLHAHGFAHDPEAPWLRSNARSLEQLEEPVLPGGYRLTTMAEYGDFASRAAVHRSAFSFPGAPSRFTDEVYDCVRRETPWRADLDCVAVASDGSVAAYALAWLDERNRVGELEPVGVHADEQRRGLGRAVCLHALRRLRDEGADTALVGSRGDDAYPGPRRLYESIGFHEAWRHLVYRVGHK